MNTTTYKDYTVRIEYDADDKILVGRVTAIADRLWRAPRTAPIANDTVPSSPHPAVLLAGLPAH